MAASHSPRQARLLIVIWTGIRCLRGLHSILWALSLIALNCRLVGSPPRVPVAQAYRWRGPHDRSAATLTVYRHNRAKPIHLARADANRASQLAIGVVEFSRYGGRGQTDACGAYGTFSTAASASTANATASTNWHAERSTIVAHIEHENRSSCSPDRASVACFMPGRPAAAAKSGDTLPDRTLRSSERSPPRTYELT